YWSRSRQALWRKGEESGHVQTLRELRIDCDADTILMKVDQVGGIACHTGRRACFFKKLDENAWQITEEVLKDPRDIYGLKP
ncbi:MAG: phosphoribosyl-AMP cyclohydrolase, partial [Halieaceae bacterium]|nr:phosphoribosyl-AMP cyclohydrolase [Halieaceae bacterium]